MPSERQLRLAELLADGADGVEAMIEAGWPASTASWLGLDARRYLAEAGVPIPDRPGPAPAAQGVRAPAEEPDAGPIMSDPPAEAEPRAIETETEPDATRAALDLIRSEGLDASAIEGTGKGGRITAADVHSFMETSR